MTKHNRIYFCIIYLFKSQIAITPLTSPEQAILNARDKDIVVTRFLWAKSVVAGAKLNSILPVAPIVYVCTIILPDKCPIQTCPQSGVDPNVVI